MIFIPDSQLDQWLMDDIHGGDLTTRALGIGARSGVMRFHHRQGGCISGIDTARRMLLRLGLNVEQHLYDGDIASADEILLTAKGSAQAIRDGKQYKTYWNGAAVFPTISTVCARSYNAIPLTGKSLARGKPFPVPNC